MRIGVVIDHVENEKSGQSPAYVAIKRAAQVADESGLDSIWLFDHLLFRHEPEETTGIWECWSLLCALAEATERVELGTLVLCNPFRNPALLAKMAHTLDEISAGRLILGLGAGWHQPEFDAFGYSFAQRVGRLEEALQIVTPLLRGEAVTFAGEHYQARDCMITPTGPRPAIPLLMGAFQPRMLRLTAQYADMWNTVWLGEAEQLVERLPVIQDACNKTGRDPATLMVTAGISIVFPELGPTNAFAKNPLRGSADELARAFAGYEAAGASHIMVQATPSGPAAIERVAEAARLYRG